MFECLTLCCLGGVGEIEDWEGSVQCIFKPVGPYHTAKGLQKPIAPLPRRLSKGAWGEEVRNRQKSFIQISELCTVEDVHLPESCDSSECGFAWEDYQCLLSVISGHAVCNPVCLLNPGELKTDCLRRVTGWLRSDALRCWFLSGQKMGPGKPWSSAYRTRGIWRAMTESEKEKYKAAAKADKVGHPHCFGNKNTNPACWVCCLLNWPFS